MLYTTLVLPIRSHRHPSLWRHLLEFRKLSLNVGYARSSWPIPAHCAPWPVNMKLRAGAADERTGLDMLVDKDLQTSSVEDATTKAFQGNTLRLCDSVYERLSIS